MKINITTLTTLLILFACAFTVIACTSAQEPAATAVVETAPVHGDGDACDDLCIWLHPTDPSLSTVIGTDPDYKIEGCVADDKLARLYLAQEIAGRIWRVNAEPSESVEKPFLVDQPKTDGGHTVADVEGLTIYYKRDGTGYLLASNQGNHTYTVYAREGDNKYLMTFKVTGSDSVDAATSDDSIDVVPIHLNETFPKGLLVVEDGKNTTGGKAAHDNYKLVPWEAVAAIGSPTLDVDTAWDPRKVGAKEDSTSDTPEQEGR